MLARSYPLYVNIWKREVMDSHRATTLGLEPATADDKALHLEARATEVEDTGVNVAPNTWGVSK